ncbi:MAG: hypothetical protein ABI851_13260 [Saprospiraceae bacterium]
MIRCINLFVFILLLSPHLIAQHSILNGAFDARSLSMGRTGVALKNNSNFINNVAHLSLLKNSGVYANYRSYYLIEGLSQINLQAFTSRSDKNAWGIQIQRDGSKELNENLFGIAYSRKFGENSSIGISANYLNKNYPESKNESAIFPGIGMQIQIIPKLTLSTQINNPLPISSKNLAKIPSQFKFGACYQIYTQLQFTTEFQLVTNQETDLKFGLEYLPNPNFALRTGYIFNGTVSFGIGYRYKENLILDSACELHPVLGTSLGFGIEAMF